MEAHGLEAERIAEHRDIAQRNGARIIAGPRIALDAITHSQPTFTNRALALFAHLPSEVRHQYDAVLVSGRPSPCLTPLRQARLGAHRFTPRDRKEPDHRRTSAHEEHK